MNAADTRVSYLARHFERVSELHYRCYMCGKKVHRDGIRAHMRHRHSELVFNPKRIDSEGL